MVQNCRKDYFVYVAFQLALHAQCIFLIKAVFDLKGLLGLQGGYYLIGVLS